MNTENKIKNIFVYLTPSLLMSIAPFLTMPIITRFLTPADFGIVAMATAAPVIIVSVLTFNIHIGAERYYFQYRNDLGKLSCLIHTTVSFLILMLLVSLPAVFIIKNYFSTLLMGSPSYGHLIFITYMIAFLNIIVAFFFTIFRNMEEAKRFSFYTILRILVNISLGLILVAGARLGYMGLIWASFADTFILFSILLLRFSSRFPFGLDRGIFIDNLKYGIPLLPTNFTGYLSQIFDKLMLSRLVSFSSTGIYSIAQNISNKLFVFMTAVQSTFHPIFMKDAFDNGNKASRSIGRNFTIFTYISIFFVLCVLLFGEEIIYLLAPASYHNAINVMLVLLCGIATQTFGKIVDVPLAYAKKAYLSLPLNIAATFLNVLLNLALIPRWGAMGAGISMTVTICIMNYITVKIAQRFYVIAYEKKALFLIYANVFLSAMMLIYVRSFESPLVLKYFIKIASFTFFLLLGVQNNIVTKKNFKAFINIFKFKGYSLAS